MATLVSSGNQTKQRSDGHKSDFFLSVFQPATLLSAQVNGSFSQGATSIDFDNGTSSDTSRIKAGQTLRVTIAGKVFKVIITGVSGLSGSSPNISGTIGIYANAIFWTNDAVVEILEIYEPLIIPPTFDAGTGISTKRLQTYTNQGTQINPFGRMGPHRFGFLTGASKTFNINSTGVAMAPGASISTYAWEATGGSIASPSSQNTTIDISATGQYWLGNTFTDSNSKTFAGRRAIFLHSPDPTDADYPYVDFIASGTGIRWQDSASMTITVHGVADFSQFIDGALVAIWRQDTYGATAGHISLISDDDGVLWQGYILEDSIVYDWNHGTVTFKAGNILEVMKRLPLQGLSIHAERSPAFWFQYDYRLTIDRIIHWLLWWHSNILELADWTPSGDTEYKKLFKFNDGTLFSQVQDIAGKRTGRMACNKAGQLFFERDINKLSETDRDAVDDYFTIQNTDWRENITIKRRHQNQVSVVRLTGFNFDGETITKICAIAPSRKVRAPSGGSAMSIDGLVLADDAEARLLSGRFLAIANNDIAEVRIDMAGNYSVLDVVPQRWLIMSLAPSDTPRGLTWTNVKLVPRDITFNLDQVNGGLLTSVVLEPEAEGPDGIDDTCGDVPTAEIPNPPWEDTGSDLSTLVAFASTSIRRDTDSDWTSQSADDADGGAIDPYWKIKAGTADPEKLIVWRIDGGDIYRSVDAGETWQNVTPVTSPDNTWSDSPAPSVENLTFVQILPDIWQNKRWFALAGWQNGSSNWRGWLAVTENDGVSWAWYDLTDGGTPPTQVKPVWAAVNGTHVLVTLWEDDASDTLRLHQRDASDLTFTADFSMGASTLANLDDRDLFAFPVVVLDDDDRWYVAGRMVDPGGLTGTYHVITTANAGSSFSSVDNLHGTQHVGALEVGVDVSGDREFYGCVQ